MNGILDTWEWVSFKYILNIFSFIKLTCNIFYLKYIVQEAKSFHPVTTEPVIRWDAGNLRLMPCWVLDRISLDGACVCVMHVCAYVCA